MDLIKIGKYIAFCRKKKNLTQEQLAEKLYITDRAISKWENGICLPDAGNMPLLCEILDITINDLFSGEVVDMKDKEKNLEENLLEMTKLKEENDKQLLNLEIAIGIVSTITFLTLVFVASFIDMQSWLRILLILIGFVTFFTSCCFAIGIEQKAGYYKCNECNHKYVPTYKSVFLAAHNGRTRYMKCPKCGKKSWQKKVMK